MFKMVCMKTKYCSQVDVIIVMAVINVLILIYRGAGSSWIDRRIDPSWGGPIELFLIPASAPQRLWYVLSCLWDGAYKRTLAVNR